MAVETATWIGTGGSDLVTRPGHRDWLKGQAGDLIADRGPNLILESRDAERLGQSFRQWFQVSPPYYRVR